MNYFNFADCRQEVPQELQLVLQLIDLFCHLPIKHLNLVMVQVLARLYYFTKLFTPMVIVGLMAPGLG